MQKKHLSNHSVIVVVMLSMMIPFLMGQQGCIQIPTQDQDTETELSANAGEDKTITLGDSISLDGSATGGTPPYVYNWTPAEDLNDASSATPTCTPTTEGTMTYTLTVTDSESHTDTDTVTITVNADGLPLTAEAGANLNVAVNIPVQLDGSASGGTPPYTYSWTPTTGLSNAAIANPTYTSAQATTAELTLTVTDSEGATAQDTVQVTVQASAAPTTLSSLTWGANYAGDGYEVLAKFSQQLDQTTAETLTYYKINGDSTYPSSATLSADKKTVTLRPRRPSPA